MTSLEALQESLSSQGKKASLPPVEKWNPPLSGTMDLIIKSNGEWWHEGVQIQRQSLVTLLASVLKREGDEYFLVSPVEKWQITVEDVPLLVTQINFIDAEKAVELITATEDCFVLSADNPLQVKYGGDSSENVRPYVKVRANLYGLLHRNVYYQLVERAISKTIDNSEVYGIESRGAFFRL